MGRALRRNADVKMQWNAGGWFGGQLGGTAWMLVAAILTVLRDPAAGTLVFAIFATPHIVGLALWRRRDRVSCYGATQLLLAIMGACGLLAVYVLERQGNWTSIQSGGTVSASYTYLIITLVVAILMLMFYLRFGRSTNGPTG